MITVSYIKRHSFSRKGVLVQNVDHAHKQGDRARSQVDRCIEPLGVICPLTGSIPGGSVRPRRFGHSPDRTLEIDSTIVSPEYKDQGGSGPVELCH